jgi:AcrR family transcriptional regulator
MGLREKQTAERKRRILDAADVLIRQTGGTEFSMRMLAQIAEVSPATPYNLFDSKEGILSALLERSLSRTMLEGLQPQSSDPLDFVVTSTAKAVDLLTSQKELLRPLYQYLLGVVDPLHHPLHISRSTYYWRTVAETTLPDLLHRDQPPFGDYDEIGSMLFAHFLGLLDLWIHEDIRDEAFRTRAIYGGLLIVSSLVMQAESAQVYRMLEEARRAMSVSAKKKGQSVATSKKIKAGTKSQDGAG